MYDVGVYPEPDYTDWHALKERRAAAVRESLCTCCASIIRVGDSWPRPVRAAVEWICANGNRELLCDSCHGYWRANAAEDPHLAPRRVTPLEVEAA